MQSLRWSAATLVLWWILGLLIAVSGAWKIVGVPHMTPMFADWHAIMSAVDCQVQGYDVFLENPCDIRSRVHVYGRPWLWLGELGLGALDVPWMGWSLAVAFMVAAVLLLSPVDFQTFALSAAILFSPAISLAVERGNNDVLVFLCLMFSAWLVTRPRSDHTGGYWCEGAAMRQLAALLIVFGLVALKFYPIVAFAALAIAARDRREFAITVVGGAVLIAIWLFLAWGDLVVVVVSSFFRTFDFG